MKSSICALSSLWTALQLLTTPVQAQALVPKVPLPPDPLPEGSTLRIPSRVVSEKGGLAKLNFFFQPADAEVDRFLKIGDVRQEFGVTGKGLTVAVLDTGINSYHPDFSGGKVVANLDFTGEEQGEREDINGHGSNVASIVAGRDEKEGGQNTGIAPGAKLAVLKVFGSSATGSFEPFIRALTWVRDHRVEHKIGVVNLSVGAGTNLLAPNQPASDQERDLVNLIRELRANGVVVVAAAGNFYQHVQGMDFPGILKETVSVGAVFDSDLQQKFGPYRSNGGVANFSIAGRCTPFTQRLSEKVTPEFRTDVFAPGAIVTGAGPVHRNTDLSINPEESAASQSIQDGTSQATPVVAGVALLLQERYQRLLREARLPEELPSVEIIEACLRDGRDFDDLEDNVGQAMDNVVSTGDRFVILDPRRALVRLDAEAKKVIQSKRLVELEARKASIKVGLEFLQAPGSEAQKEVLQKAKRFSPRSK